MKTLSFNLQFQGGNNKDIKEADLYANTVNKKMNNFQQNVKKTRIYINLNECVVMNVYCINMSIV